MKQSNSCETLGVVVGKKKKKQLKREKTTELHYRTIASTHLTEYDTSNSARYWKKVLRERNIT